MGVPEMQTQPYKKGHIASYKPSCVEVRSLNDSRFVFSVHLSLLSVSSSEIQASPNTNATLPCNVTLFAEGDNINQSLIAVSWIKNGSEIASFGKAATQIKEGFSWDNADFVNGDFSLVVLKASLDLQGMYECTISYNFTILHYSNVTFSIIGTSCFRSRGFDSFFSPMITSESKN